jgi:uncharacterized protein (TIGR02246 family)
MMAARTPEDIHQRFAEAINAGNAQSLLALFEPDAALVPEPGQLVRGREAISGAFQGFLGMKPTLRIDTQSIIQAGDIALLRSRWTLRGSGPDGKPIEMAGNGMEVVRRQPDGTWLFVIDHPFGAS